MKLNECKYKIGDKVWFVENVAIRSGLVCGSSCSHYSDNEDMEITDNITLKVRVMNREFDYEKMNRYDADRQKQFKEINIDHDEVFSKKDELMRFVTARSDD